MKRLLDSHEPRNLLRLLSPRCGGECMLCQLLGVMMLESSALKALCRQESRGLLMLSPKLTELFRGEETTPLLEKWFPGDSAQAGLPGELSGRARAMLKPGAASREVHTLERHGETLVIECFRLNDTPGHSRVCLVSLREVRPPSEAPEAWRGRLSARQFDIASLVLRGASNETIATHFRTTLGTVKKQVSTIFDRLGVNSRSQLCALAARHR